MTWALLRPVAATISAGAGVWLYSLSGGGGGGGAIVTGNIFHNIEDGDACLGLST